jgi:hypothetical protein
LSTLTWPRPLVIEPVRPPADALAPVNVTLPKSASERMWQSWLDGVVLYLHTASVGAILVSRHHIIV